MEKKVVVPTRELVDRLGMINLFGLSKTQSVDFLRNIFMLINEELNNIPEGRLTIQGFGVFIVRSVEMADGSKVRRIVFKSK